ncbi:MAG: ATP phosphoribosyltransferase regulatory subunit [Helicobacteraceae bacterium]|nr:ATP phosphoribosyltransferase regulatory subunit [Helicobacteraceae bacterium]
MIFEHEIPESSKLYFGESAKKKRFIENVASDVLSEGGFEEIVTPLFSYHQHRSIADERELIRVNDVQNHNMSLRADSTIDVVRIINKRLGRNTTHKKWFYVQPVFKYPSIEQYQVGAEYIDEEKLSCVLDQSLEIMKELDLEPLLQISNINIPKIITTLCDLTLDDFKHINIEKMLSLKIEWLEKLVYLHNIEDIDSVIEIVPDAIKVELEKIKELCSAIEYKNVAIAPLYYAQMLYYDELYFRIIDQNEVFARGGRYKSEESKSVGFAIYVDALIEKLIELDK